MIQRVYIDTSVIGGCFDIEFKERSVELFDEFITGKKIAIISDITLDELEDARSEIREQIELIPERFKAYIQNNDETEKLAEKYIKEGAIGRKSYEDALHIAIATVNKIDVLVSWNFKHIVNLD